MRNQRGYTLPELLIGMSMALIVILAAFALLETATRSSARTAARVDANQQVRPVMERIMDELRSSCVRRGAVPVLSGSGGNSSTATSLSFLHQTGSGVAPVPDKRTITYDATAKTLTETAYPASPTTQNADGTWTFSSTPIANSTRRLLDDSPPANVGTGTVSTFRYYKYVNGSLQEITTLPLSATDAADTVQVTVSIASSPLNPMGDTKASVTLADTALLRFGPPTESTTTPIVPCT